MAVQFKTKHTRGTIYLFRPEDIVIKPELNGRHDPPDLTELKASILEYGQVHPVVIRSEAGKPVLCIGFSRWSAISELNRNRSADLQIKIACTYIRLNEQDAYVSNYEENRKRNSTTPMDDAHHFAQMERWGLGHSAIAKRFKVKKSFVVSRLALIEADETVQKAVVAGRLKPTAAVKIAKLSAQQQREIVEGNGRVTGRAVAQASGERQKASMKELRGVIEEEADTAPIVAVQTFAKKLLGMMDGEPLTQ